MKLRRFPKEALDYWLPKINDEKFHEKIWKIANEMPFDEESRQHVTERIAAVFTQLRPENFYRLTVKQNAPLYLSESDGSRFVNIPVTILFLW